MFAAEIRRTRVSRMRFYSNWQWHLDEVFVKINGETHYLWRAVDHEGELLESYVTKRRDRKAALKFLTKAMKRYGRPEVLVTDKLRSYGAAMKLYRQHRSSGNRPLAEQQGGEFPLAVSTTRTRYAPLPTDALSAKVRCRPLFSPQPFQSGAPLLLTRQFQAQSNRRSY